jgi:hypothetical protein
MAGTPNDTPNPTLLINSGVGKYQIGIYMALASITDAIVGGYRFTHRGRIISINFDVTIPASTASKLTTLTPTINGTALTAASGSGGELALTTALCARQTSSAAIGRVAGTAITGGNSFVSGDLLLITGSSTTAFVEGQGIYLIEVVNDDTQNYVAQALFGLRSANPA